MLLLQTFAEFRKKYHKFRNERVSSSEEDSFNISRKENFENNNVNLREVDIGYLCPPPRVAAGFRNERPNFEKARKRYKFI